MSSIHNEPIIVCVCTYMLRASPRIIPNAFVLFPPTLHNTQVVSQNLFFFQVKKSNRCVNVLTIMYSSCIYLFVPIIIMRSATYVYVRSYWEIEQKLRRKLMTKYHPQLVMESGRR